MIHEWQNIKIFSNIVKVWTDGVEKTPPTSRPCPNRGNPECHPKLWVKVFVKKILVGNWELNYGFFYVFVGQNVKWFKSKDLLACNTNNSSNLQKGSKIKLGYPRNCQHHWYTIDVIYIKKIIIKNISSIRFPFFDLLGVNSLFIFFMWICFARHFLFIFEATGIY